MKLENGLRVFLLEDHEVPLVKATLLMKGGARASPPDKVNLLLHPLHGQGSKTVYTLMTDAASSRNVSNAAG